MQVWVGEEGEYSDRMVCYVFATEEEGNRWKAAVTGSYPSRDLTAYEVVESLGEQHTRLSVYVSVYRGRPETSWEESEEVFDVDHPKAIEVSQVVGLSMSGPNADDYIAITVDGIDPERVRKVSSERRAQAVAEFDLIQQAERVRRYGS